MENETKSCCCSARKPTPADIPKESASCCQARSCAAPSEKPGNFWYELYEKLEPGLIVLSALALAASFFHWGHGLLPFDPAWVAIVFCGGPRFYGAVKTLAKGRISVDVLISTAIIATIIADRLYFRMHSSGEGEGHGHSYLFAGGEVAFIMALGHLLEEWTITRARAGIENLVKLTPQTARRLDGSAENETVVPVSEVVRNDLLRVLPGETIPVDGEIVSGNTSIDQSLITGESLPVDRFEGDTVFGGTINRFGSFTMRADRVGEDSSLARMIRLVREAEQKKAPMERIADRWASILVPVALLTAVVVGLVTYSFTNIPEDALRRAVTILVVFCPCSLVLATPTAIIAAIGNASHHGILIRSGEVLERLATVDVVAFDKTGTLTHGQPQLTAAIPFDPQYDSNGLLAVAASAETLSEHPLAACVVQAAAERGLERSQTANFEMHRGEGIVVELDGPVEEQLVFAGNDRLLARFGIEMNDFQKSQAEERFAMGETVIWIAVAKKTDRHRGTVIGLLSLADTVRETSPSSIRQVRDIGVDTVLLTGDNDRAARSVGMQSGVGEVRAELLPEGKVEAIDELTAKGRRVVMVGDGLNDAPALKSAEVGIAMGKVGSDLTIEAADIVLIGDDISRVPFLIRLARKTKRTILNNICLSMGINAVAIVLASTGVMGPVVGALVHNAGSVFVVLNASLLLNVKRYCASDKQSNRATNGSPGITGKRV